MGNEQSQKRRRAETEPNVLDQPPATASPQTEEGSKDKKQPESDLPPVPDECHVMISCSKDAADIELAKLIKGGLESVSIPVYIACNRSKEEADQAAKVLVDTKLLVFVASQTASTSGKCQDQISFAYVSDKPIIVAAKDKKTNVIKDFNVGMKLTLDELHWSIFDNDDEQAATVRQFVQLIQEQLNPKQRVTPEPGASVPAARPKRRLNTKLRAQSTQREMRVDDGQIETFWERNFDEDEVMWFKFQQAFLSDYNAQLSGLFNEDSIPWLLDMLKNDIFGGAEKVTREQFMDVRGDSRDKNAFWRVVSQVAIEKYNMREVFDMNSTVRLTAITKLATFQNPAVVDALIHLLEEEDPNVRAVAAISLGRTGKCTDEIVDCLIKLLKDGDRIVRQSACLSLGTLKAVKAIPLIGDRWRNDFISVVRNAARTALENMNIPEAKEVLQVTKVLEDEIEALAGNQAAV